MSSFERVSHVLLDWDGCVALGDVPLREAVAFIRRWPQRVAIVSNNSTHLPEDFANILARAGAPLPASRILLAGFEALVRARETGAKNVMILGDRSLKAHARKMGISIAKEQADLVVLLRDKQFSYVKLMRAANSLVKGAKLIVANPDLTHPGVNGCVVPETGALLAALLACTGAARIDIETVGKPSAHLFAQACAALGAPPQTTMMIGDNPSTDAAGAAAFGLRSLLIGAASGLTFADLPGRMTGDSV